MQINLTDSAVSLLVNILNQITIKPVDPQALESIKAIQEIMSQIHPVAVKKEEVKE